MKQPSVSIIVPVYNVGPYVEDSIRSVMRQTYTGPMECIIVDDCGTDDSMEKVERLISEYNGPITFQVLHHTHNRGLSAARNTGMDAASGDYLFFLDSDDELTDDCIETLTEPLLQEWYDMIIGDYSVLVEINESKYGLEKLAIPDNTVLYKDKIIESYNTGKWPATAWNKLYLTDFIKRGSFCFKEGFLFEDAIWTFQIACSIQSLLSVKHTTYLHGRRMGSIMTSSSEETKKLFDYLIFIEICKFVSENGVRYSRIQDVLRIRLNRVLYYNLNSPDRFIQTYKTIRDCFRPSLGEIICANKCCLKKYFKDFHYVLPKPIAAYWHYWVYYRFRLCLKNKTDYGNSCVS